LVVAITKEEGNC